MKNRSPFASLFSFVSALAVMTACGHTQDTPTASITRKNAGIEKVAAIDIPPTQEVAKDDLRVGQVAVVSGADDETDRTIKVDQLAQDSRGDYAFDTIEGDNPCDEDAQGTERCRAASEEVVNAANASRKKRGSSAEAELQALTNRIIDPETFDPVTTIDEIGRGDLPGSLAAQSLGSEFLTPPVMEEPTESSAADPTGIRDLPPVVLDITVTQTEGN